MFGLNVGPHLAKADGVESCPNIMKPVTFGLPAISPFHNSWAISDQLNTRWYRNQSTAQPQVAQMKPKISLPDIVLK